MKLKKGDQIMYVPTHAVGEFNHPDIEFGFITSFNPQGSAFCRYWLNPDRKVLRTTANSECTPIDMIQRFDLKPQEVIDKMLIALGY